MEADKNVFTASHRFARISPQKARIVMDVIRGKSAEDALTTLRFVQRRASPMIQKVLRSAIANATQKAGVSGEELVVCKACVDDGPRAKRWRPRAMGRGYPRIRRYCHLTVSLTQSPKVPEGRKKGPPEGSSSGSGGSGSGSSGSGSQGASQGAKKRLKG